MAKSGCCSWSPRFLIILFFLISAVPLALIASLERSAAASPGAIRYRSGGLLRDCAAWDPVGRRFLVTTVNGGGIAEVAVPEGWGGEELEERVVVADPDVGRNWTAGIALDRKRGRVLVVFGNPWGFHHSGVAAYNLDTLDRLFLTHLSGPGDEQAFADDLALDEDGNAYISDVKSSKLWKVGLNGELLSVIRSDLFTPRKEWYHNIAALNGIVYHPNGYVLVIHTASGYLFKVGTVSEKVTVVKVRGSLLTGDGMALLSPTKLVITGLTSSARVVESSDDWETATVTERYVGPRHRVAASAVVKDGKVYLNHLIGGGLTKWTHFMTEAIFLPVTSN